MRRESGFTLIEVLVAGLVLVIGLIALTTVFVAGQSQASADTQQVQLIGIADQEIEQVRAAVSLNGFSALGMNTTPSQISNRVVRSTFFDPDTFVVTPVGTACYLITTNYDSVNTSAPTGHPVYGVTAPAGFTGWSLCDASTSVATDAEPIQVLSGAGPAPIVTWSATSVPQCANGAAAGITVPCWVPLSAGCTYTASSITTVPSCAATVYAFVTDTYVGCGSTPSAVACPSLSNSVLQCTAANMPTTTTASTPCGDARRLIVAVVPNPPDQTSPGVSHQLARVTPVYLSTILTDPTPAGANASSAGLTLNLSVL